MNEARRIQTRNLNPYIGIYLANTKALICTMVYDPL